MQTVSTNGVVNTNELQLAAKLAKIDLPEDFLLKTPYANKYASGWEADNSPRGVKWRPFYEAVAYPNLKDGNKEEFLKQHAAKESKRAEKAAAQKAAAEAAAAAAAAAPGPVKKRRDIPEVSDQELRRAHSMIKARLSSQFGELRQAFRAFDTDASGFISVEEAESTLSTLELGLPKRIVSRIIDIADYDGDGDISFAEFCRVLTADDIIYMKDSLSAGTGGNHAVVDTRLKERVERAGPKVLAEKNGVKVTDKDVRTALFQIKERLMNKYKRLDTAFKAIDADRSGYLTRDELRFALMMLNLDVISKEVLDVILDMVDKDGDGQVNHYEFVTVLTAKDPLAQFSS